ncbi:LysM peptidoglycan-binding domain-containing protein [Antribacter gilvus]|uniref:LysM peptidoglycan-binding domain-containing protein n=1 Tax=Antribacter gilvus TaxID=2304675 RepID=UPI000F7B65BE|nr:LysM peptidoglycan-binding domain-containing protein [Antribacter gilvus]
MGATTMSPARSTARVRPHRTERHLYLVTPAPEVRRHVPAPPAAVAARPVAAPAGRAPARPAPAPPAAAPPAPAPQGLAARLGLDGLRLTRRGRAVLVVLVALVLAPAATWGATAVASSSGPGVEVRVHVVQPGESLWDFATPLTAPGEDVRSAVARIKDLNDLDDATLRVGQVLLLPVE